MFSVVFCCFFPSWTKLTTKHSRGLALKVGQMDYFKCTDLRWRLIDVSAITEACSEVIDSGLLASLIKLLAATFDIKKEVSFLCQLGSFHFEHIIRFGCEHLSYVWDEFLLARLRYCEAVSCMYVCCMSKLFVTPTRFDLQRLMFDAVLGYVTNHVPKEFFPSPTVQYNL